MLRKIVPQRPDWIQRCKDVGFDYCDLPSSDSSWYWSEGVAYEFTLLQIDDLDDATTELHGMCMEVVRDIIKSGDFPEEYQLNDVAKTLISQSWARGDLHLYGRFDLAYDGKNIKMLEYNADTPTSLLESAVVQWNWLEEAPNIPHRDQFNSTHEILIERWKEIKAKMNCNRIHFCGTSEAGREDWGNIEYLMDTAIQGGINVSELAIEDIGYLDSQFVDLEDNPIKWCFKLYPWEWMVNDHFAAKLLSANTRWIEPPWKMLLSNKALLPILWDKFEGHPLLLPTIYDRGTIPAVGKWVRKPILAREGANVSQVDDTTVKQLSGSEFHDQYDKNGYVYQQWVDLPYNSGFRPIIGSWVIGDRATGICIREDYNVVTGNDSHFVPHYFV